jgi:hypothetical protein
VSTFDHIRLAVGYDSSGNIITYDPWNNSNRAQFTVPNYDGKNAKYNNTSRVNVISDGSRAKWFYTLEISEVSKPTNLSFKNQQRIKASRRYSDDPVDGLNIRSAIGGPVLGKAGWGTLGTIIGEPKIGYPSYFYRVKWDTGIEGYVSETYIRDSQYSATTRAYSVDSTVYSTNPYGTNVRSEPSINGSIVRFQPAYNKGYASRKVDKETDYDWLYIKWENGTEGWSVSDNITEREIKPEAINQNAWTNVEARLRSEPTTNGGDSTVLGMYGIGTYAWVLEDAGNANGMDWVKVNLLVPKTILNLFGPNENKLGYITKNALSKLYIASVSDQIDKNAVYITTTNDSIQKSTPIKVRTTKDGYSEVTKTVKWGTEVKIIDGAYYSAGYNRVKIRYIENNIFGIPVTNEGWIPYEFLIKK